MIGRLPHALHSAHTPWAVTARDIDCAAVLLKVIRIYQVARSDFAIAAIREFVKPFFPWKRAVLGADPYFVQPVFFYTAERLGRYILIDKSSLQVRPSILRPAIPVLKDCHLMQTDETIIETDFVRDKERIMQVRMQVFVKEQGVPPELEQDEKDPLCLHALLLIDSHPVATGRLEPDGHIGRIAVIRSYRKKGLGSRILAYLEDKAKKLGLSRV